MCTRAHVCGRRSHSSPRRIRQWRMRRCAQRLLSPRACVCLHLHDAMRLSVCFCTLGYVSALTTSRLRLLVRRYSGFVCVGAVTCVRERTSSSSSSSPSVSGAGRPMPADGLTSRLAKPLRSTCACVCPRGGCVLYCESCVGDGRRLGQMLSPICGSSSAPFEVARLRLISGCIF